MARMNVFVAVREFYMGAQPASQGGLSTICPFSPPLPATGLASF